jgi:RNA polymerase sigma-70 factor (ECF subfamily)
VPDDFVLFYESEAPRLVRSVAVAVGDPVLAEDAVAEAFARAWSRWSQVRAMEWPVAWVARVALNQARDRFRRRRVERRNAMVVARDEVSLDDTTHVDHQLWAAVRDLPRQECVLIALRYFADLSQAEIADALGIPPGTVASGLNRARQKLGAALGAAYQEELT